MYNWLFLAPVYGLICPYYGSNVVAKYKTQMYRSHLWRNLAFLEKFCTGYGSQFRVIRHIYWLHRWVALPVRPKNWFRGKGDPQNYWLVHWLCITQDLQCFCTTHCTDQIYLKNWTSVCHWLWKYKQFQCWQVYNAQQISNALSETVDHQNLIVATCKSIVLVLGNSWLVTTTAQVVQPQSNLLPFPEDVTQVAYWPVKSRFMKPYIKLESVA